jgi:FAD/FMN-containing dehydrogenase
MQYITDWPDAEDGGARLKSLNALYDAMRPHVSGAAYVNYCDLDLGSRAPRAYWGDNLERLEQIKKTWDPDNVFRHPQSVPVA